MFQVNLLIAFGGFIAKRTVLFCYCDISKQQCLSLSFIDIDNSGYVSDYELQDLFKEASLPLPGYKVREIVEKIIAVTDNNKDGKINFEEFVSVSVLLLQALGLSGLNWFGTSML